MNGTDGIADGSLDVSTIFPDRPHSWVHVSNVVQGVGGKCPFRSRLPSTETLDNVVGVVPISDGVLSRSSIVNFLRHALLYRPKPFRILVQKRIQESKPTRTDNRFRPTAPWQGSYLRSSSASPGVTGGCLVGQVGDAQRLFCLSRCARLPLF